jgi:uncharacterized protein (DUF885 family)
MRGYYTIFILLAFGLFNCGTPEGNRVPSTAETEAIKLKEFADNLAPSGSRHQVAENDLSDASYAETLRKIHEQIEELSSIDTALLVEDDLIDWKFAFSILAGRRINEEHIQPWKKDPRIYLGFTRQISNLIGKPGTSSEKIESILQLLEIIPDQLQNGAQQLIYYVPRFQELSVFMAENGRILFERDLPKFITQLGEDALEQFINFLKEELPSRSKGDFPIGEEIYNAMLRDQFLLGYDADSLYRFGWKKFNETVTELEAVAHIIDPDKSWQELAIEIKNEFPEPDKMIEAHQHWVDRSKQHILANQLFTIPWQERVEVVPRAEYLRKTSYYGNFSRARKKDANGIFTSRWMINPFEEQWEDQVKQEYLTEHDWGVIIVTAPHETYGGHHLQGLYQMHNPRSIRKNNGLSLFSEGWGLYNEHLMEETGFFPNEKIHLRQLQLRLWRNARVIYDVGLHTGRMTYEEAIQLMTDKVGFLRWAAQLEVDSATSSPGYFIGYYLGMYEILRMREDYKALKGEEFSLSDFHETLLRIGNMPPALMREALFMDFNP